MPNPYLIGQNISQTLATVPISVAQTTAAGDKITVGIVLSFGSVSGVTDSKGNTYSPKQSDVGGLGPPTYEFIADGATTPLVSGTDQINVACSSATSFKAMAAVGQAGMATTAYDVGANADSAGSTAPSVTSPTLGQASETAVSVIGTANGAGVPTAFGTGWTSLVSGLAGGSGGPRLSVIWQTVSSTAAVTASATIASSKWAALIATFKSSTVVVTVTPTTVPDVTAKSPYSQTFSASGGTSYTWAETGALPSGMSFSSGGVLSGTTAQVGSFPITVTATDVSGAKGSVSLTLVVDPAAPITGAGLVGANVPPAAWGTNTTQAQAITNWLGIVTPRPLTVRRVFYGVGGTPPAITTDLQADANAGRKACISLKPAYNPVSTADLAAIDTFLQSCVNGGLVADVCIWDGPFGSGLTAAKYIAAVQYYGPTIRKYYSLVFSESASDVQINAAGAFYPGDAYVDKVAASFFAVDYNAGVTLDAIQAIADNASPPKPFGLWSFNASLTP